MHASVHGSFLEESRRLYVEVLPEPFALEIFPQDKCSTSLRGTTSIVTTTPGISATSGATSSQGLVPGQGSTALRGDQSRVRPQGLVPGQGSTAPRGGQSGVVSECFVPEQGPTAPPRAQEEEKEVMDSAECFEWVELRDDTAGRPDFWNRRSRAAVCLGPTGGGPGRLAVLAGRRCALLLAQGHPCRDVEFARPRPCLTTWWMGVGLRARVRCLGVA